MGIFKIFGKEKGEVRNIDRSNEEEHCVYEKVDYHFEQAEKVYLQTYKLEKLSGDDLRIIERYAGNHIGLFLTWIIENDFFNNEYDIDNRDFEKVKSGELLGVDFLMKHMDGKFYSSDVIPHIRPFAKLYNENWFWRDYTYWATQELCDLPFEFVATLEEYNSFKPIIDKRYHEFKEKSKLSV